MKEQLSPFYGTYAIFTQYVIGLYHVIGGRGHLL